jgi:hypothetical protein
MEEVLPQIGHPVLILIGSEDKLLCAGDYKKMRQLLAREQLEIYRRKREFFIF